MKQKVHSIGQLLFMLLVLGTAAMFWFLFVFQPTPVRNVQVSLVDNFTWAGGQFRVSYQGEEVGYCPSYTFYQIVDSQKKVFNASFETPQPNDIIRITVPESIAPGKAMFTMVTYYRCNPFKEILVESPKLELQVVS